MKIKLAYPKIPDSKGFLPKTCVAFEKIDGTNLHWTCNHDFGWHSFGTRRDSFAFDKYGISEFNKAHPGLEEAPIIFDRVYKDIINLSKVNNEITVFLEFYGDNSFAGMHDPNDKKRLSLLDVSVNGELLNVKQFLDSFSTYCHTDPMIDQEYDIPKIVYGGKFHGQFVEDVRNGKYPVNEGVVCKGVYKNQIYMCKIKTNAYMEKLKNKFKDNWINFWE